MSKERPQEKGTITFIVRSCGDKKHKTGCILDLDEGDRKYHHSIDSGIVADFDKQGNLISIEFIDGVKINKKDIK